MNTKLLLSLSAIVMGAAGIAGTFMPQELLNWVGAAPGGVLPVVVQILSALLFAFAMVNWTARGSLLGGIYNRPVAIGNLAHFTIGALAVTKAAMVVRHDSILWFIALVYCVFAFGFAVVFFRSPAPTRTEPRQSPPSPC